MFLPIYIYVSIYICVFLPMYIYISFFIIMIYVTVEKSHGQGNLGGYSPWGCKKSYTTENACSVCIIYLSIIISGRGQRE